MTAFSDELKHLMTERGIGVRELARKVPCSPGHLSSIRNGRKPPSRGLAVRIDQTLGVDGDLADLAFEDRGGTRKPPTPKDQPPRPRADVLEKDSRAVGADEEHDERIAVWTSTEVLDGALFPPVGISADSDEMPTNCGLCEGHTMFEDDPPLGEAALRWVVTPPHGGLKPFCHPASESIRIGEGDVRQLRMVGRHLKAIDDACGGEAALPMAISYLRDGVRPLLKGSFDEGIGQLLLSSAAQLALDAGWMAYDGRADQRFARHLMLHSLRLADAANNRLLGGRILCALAHQAIYVGEVELAVDLCRAARFGTSDMAPPKLVAMMAAMEACAHAAAGDSLECTDALHDAERALSKAERDEGPQWLDFDEGGLLGHAARAHRDLAWRRSGVHRRKAAEEALRFASQSIALCRHEHGRTRAQRNMILATTHLLLDDVDEASVIGSRIVDDAWDVNSRHVHDDVAALTKAVKIRHSETVILFLDQAQEFLAARRSSPSPS